MQKFLLSAAFIIFALTVSLAIYFLQQTRPPAGEHCHKVPDHVNDIYNYMGDSSCAGNLNGVWIHINPGCQFCSYLMTDLAILESSFSINLVSFQPKETTLQWLYQFNWKGEPPILWNTSKEVIRTIFGHDSTPIVLVYEEMQLTYCQTGYKNFAVLKSKLKRSL